MGKNSLIKIRQPDSFTRLEQRSNKEPHQLSIQDEPLTTAMSRDDNSSLLAKFSEHTKTIIVTMPQISFLVWLAVIIK